MAISTKLKRIPQEFGITSVHATGKDAYLIILSRTCRMFAYGTNSLILGIFFSALGFSDYKIGVFMTLTLVGDVVLSIILTMIADKVGRRKIMFAGSFLMVMSGLIFALFENFWILLVAAVVGVISATGGDYGPFRAIEESMLSHLTTPETRSDVFSWYVTTSALGSSIGSEASGRIVHFLKSRDGWTEVDAYHALFWLYTAMGFINAFLMVCLSSACEISDSMDAEGARPAYALVANDEEDSDEEGEEGGSNTTRPRQSPSTPVAATAATLPSPSKSSSTLLSHPAIHFFTSRFAQISAPTRSIMYKLWFLLAVDSVADGMVPWSLTNYYLDLKFHLPKSTLGDFTSISYFLACVGTLFAAPLSKRLGLINTMVFTHIPSSLAVVLFPLPRGIVMTVILLFIRTGLNNMDQAPRSAFIAAVVRPEERTAVMGITAMMRTLAATLGPTITGLLAGNDRFWIAFVAAGALRLAYDFGLWAMFVNMKINQFEGGGNGHGQRERPVPAKEVDSRMSRISNEEEADAVEMTKR